MFISVLASDLDSIRALFNEKEKELSVAVAKVEELTRQLEDIRRGRANATARETVQPTAAAQELEKLRRELMVNNFYYIFAYNLFIYYIFKNIIYFI